MQIPFVMIGLPFYICINKTSHIICNKSEDLRCHLFCVSGQREIREDPWWAQQVHAAVHGEHGGCVRLVPAVWGEEAELPPRGASGCQTPS